MNTVKLASLDVDTTPAYRHAGPTTAIDPRLLELWDSLDDFGARAIDPALKHCLEKLSVWVGAQNASWLGLVKPRAAQRASIDPLAGWRIGALENLYPSGQPRRRQMALLQEVRSLDAALTIKPLVAHAGSYRTHSLRNYLQENDSGIDLERLYQRHGIADRLWMAVPVSADCESIFCFDSLEPNHHFSGHDFHLVWLALRGIRWWHRQLLLSHGLRRDIEPLSPAGRRVLNELLTGAPEKSIAERLSITPASAHQYVKCVYRHFGVHGRAEFMSLWLNRVG